MTLALQTITHPTTALITIDEPQPTSHPMLGGGLRGGRYSPNPYFRFFSFEDAYQSVLNHVLSLPSSRTPERHTFNNYTAGLDYFLAFIDDQLPTEELMQAYIAHLTQRGLKSSTISAKYLAPVRLFCRALAKQDLYKNATGEPSEMLNLSIALPECRERIRQAADIPNPKSEESTNIAPLWNPKFHRLALTEVNAVVRSIDRSHVAGLRDYALLMTAFTTALRLAEISRMTPASITKEGDTWIITVRGKRSNSDPVPTSDAAAQAVFDYVSAFNAGLDPDDSRRINDDTPLWQPMMHGENNYVAIGYNNYTPRRGMCTQAIRKLMARRVEAALGFTIAAHDFRRTAAALAFKAGMPLPEIQKLLRHKNPSTTLNYIGQEPDYAAAALSTYVQIG
jgi:integrase